MKKMAKENVETHLWYWRLLAYVIVGKMLEMLKMVQIEKLFLRASKRRHHAQRKKSGTNETYCPVDFNSLYTAC